jgi:hypothetical protein
MKNLKARSKGEERRTFLKTALAGILIGAESLRERKTAVAVFGKSIA